MRATSLELMNTPYFTKDQFHVKYDTELRRMLDVERENNVFEVRRKARKVLTIINNLVISDLH